MAFARVTEHDVRAAIDTIIDPCSRAAGAPAGLVAMGLVRTLEIATSPEGARVLVTVGVTEYGCLMGPAFAEAVEQVLRELPGVAAVDVELDAAFDWMPEDMSPRYRATLAERRRRARRHLAARALGPAHKR